jgi:hypothetical protein
MKKCLYCGRENDEAATSCCECGTEFNSSSAAEVDPRLTDTTLAPIIVGRFRNVIDASMARARLEAAGIEADIPEEYNPQILGNAFPNPLESVTVRVAAKDYETARQILASDA